jgi:hypothetical protein
MIVESNACSHDIKRMMLKLSKVQKLGPAQMIQ